ncbi:hypothetical protein HaLaN_13852, partial [Haematococcus lacustris]
MSFRATGCFSVRSDPARLHTALTAASGAAQQPKRRQRGATRNTFSKFEMLGGLVVESRESGTAGTDSLLEQVYQSSERGRETHWRLRAGQAVRGGNQEGREGA